MNSPKRIIVAIAIAITACETLFVAAFSTTNIINHNNNRITATATSTISPSSPSSFKTRPLHSTRNNNKSSNQSVTSSLISSLAIIALKLRLASHSSVTCNVSASSSKILLQSTVGPVSVRGKDWESPLKLTCRAIQADVDTCILDMNSVLQKRKLILTEPAVGRAMIAFNELDFGNFLKHPLLAKQVPSVDLNLSSNGDVDGTSQFEFLQKGIQIHSKESSVEFYGSCMGETWKCILSRAASASSTKRADIQVSHVAGGGAIEDAGTIASAEVELTMLLTNFFNELVFELDGTFLCFSDLMIRTPKVEGVGESNIMFALDITVKKFPSPGLEF